jgi:hypothetical protein
MKIPWTNHGNDMMHRHQRVVLFIWRKTITNQPGPMKIERLATFPLQIWAFASNSGSGQIDHGLKHKVIDTWIGVRRSS